MDMLYQLFFSIYIQREKEKEELIARPKGNNCRIRIWDYKLTVLAYADDLVLITSNYKGDVYYADNEWSGTQHNLGTLATATKDFLNKCQAREQGG